jgi:sucrose-6-phosphate hydrolase SacC (GH32 family)
MLTGTEWQSSAGMLEFASYDFRHWNFTSAFYVNKSEPSGVLYECPDLFQLEVHTVDAFLFMTVFDPCLLGQCLGLKVQSNGRSESTTIWWLDVGLSCWFGEFAFVSAHPISIGYQCWRHVKSLFLSFKQLLIVCSGQFYASKSMWIPSHRRRLQWGWIGEDDANGPQRGWQGLHSLPCEISFDPSVHYPLCSSLKVRLVSSNFCSPLTFVLGIEAPQSVDVSKQADIFKSNRGYSTSASWE